MFWNNVVDDSIPSDDEMMYDCNVDKKFKIVFFEDNYLNELSDAQI